MSRRPILASHVGSLARPPELLDALRGREHGAEVDPAALHELTRRSVAEIVAQQQAHGVDVVTDGEMSKPGFFAYVRERLGGLEVRPEGDFPFSFHAEEEAFPEYYERYFAEAMTGGTVVPLRPLVCTSPIVYQGGTALQRDLDNLTAALAAAPGGPIDHDRAFLPSIAPSGVGVNEFYASEEEYFFAVAEAMNTEYRGIVDAGFQLQVDDPFLTEICSFSDLPEAERRRRAEMYVEAVNYALRGIPADRVRFHTCYSINEGPRIFDVPFARIVDLVLRVNAGVYSFEAANPRHEHEYRIWEDVRLPADKVIMPGVITHASNIVEHPELIAERLSRFVRLVGSEHVIAGVDCGFSSQATYRPEVDARVVWAKFDALAEGTRMVNERQSSRPRHVGPTTG